MKRDDETVTQFTMRKIREEIIEECAKIAERAGCGDPKCRGCLGNQIAAAIRDAVSGATERNDG